MKNFLLKPFKAIIVLITVLGLVPVTAGALTYEEVMSNQSSQSQGQVLGAITGNQWYVSPTGSAAGNGSINSPWDITTAFKHPASVQPGDTIWLRGGRYFNNNSSFASFLHGTAAAPIYVRQYPNERASIDGGIFLNPPSAYTWYWGFEIYSSNTTRVTSWGNNSTCPIDPATGAHTSCENGSFPPDINIPAGFSVTQPPTSGGGGWMPGIKVINMLIHDTSSGVDLQSAATDSEVYGTIIYNNGWKGGDRGHGHGVYFQNIQGLKEMNDSFDFNDYDAGLQAAGTGNAVITNIHFIGNTVFNSGISGGHRVYNVILYGGPSGKGNIKFDKNYIYNDTAAPQGNTGYSSLGIWDSFNKDLTVTGNYWVGGEPALDMEMWDQLTFTGNTVFSKTPYRGFSVTLPVNGGTSHYLFDNNRYFGPNVYKPFSGLDQNSTQSSSRPTGVETFIRPNKYEPGRANITIFNWDKNPTVTVSLAGIGLSNGDKFEIRDAQGYNSALPVYSGIYSGQSVALPMTGTGIDQPIGQGQVNTHTSAEFQTFVVLPLTGIPASPPPPIGSTDVTPPTVPANLANTPISPSQTDVSWPPSTDAGSGVSGYYIYRNGIKVSTVTSGVVFHDTHLTPGSTYTYSVSAYDLVGNVSNQSSNISVTLPAAPNPVTAAGSVLFTGQVPDEYGVETTGNDELGMKFKASSPGQVTAIRFYKLAPEGSGHTGRIWSTDGTQLAAVSFTNETASGWQEQALPAPLTIPANVPYIVTVDTKNMMYPVARNGLLAQINNGLLSSVADGKNGVYQFVGNFPNKSYQSSNYFRDVRFVLTVSGSSSPPIRYGGLPTGTLASSTTAATISLQTDKNATCRYSNTVGTAYSAMSGTFSNTGGLTHSTTVNISQTGTTYYYYVRCQDTNNNFNTDDYPIIFSVASGVASGPPANPIYQYYEAEAVAIVAPMAAGQNSVASGGQYVSSPTANSGTVTFSVNVPANDTYVIWGRVYGPVSTQDSYFVSVDGGPEDIYDSAENVWASAWQWTKVNGRGGGNTPLALNPRLFTLTAGTHTITFRAREASAAIDRILVTNDQSMAAPQAPQPTTIGGTPGVSTVTDPIITPNGGNFTGSVSVAITDTTFGASIYYTTDGNNPVFTSTLYTGSFTLTSSANVKAKAFKAGMNDSNLIVAVFTQGVATPPPAIGAFSASQSAITAGQSSTLAWQTSNAASLSIDNGIGDVTGLNSKSVSPAQTTTYTLTATNSAGSDHKSVTVTVAAGTDTTPPVRSNGSPSGQLQAGTTQAVLSLSTNESATCKYGTASGTAYNSLPNTFTTTGATAHSTALAGLANGIAYNYYVRCSDSANNANTDDYLISFSVAAPSVVAAPNINPAGGTFTNNVNVALTAVTSGSAVYYTINGSDPTVSSTLYTAPFSLTQSSIVKAIAVLNGVSSSVSSKSFTIIKPGAGKQKPVGYLDGVKTDGTAFGWALDADSVTLPVTVHFYVDSPVAAGKTPDFIATASENRAAIGKHAFNVAVPSSFRDGVSHKLYAYGIDLTDASGASNKLLLNSPASFTLGCVQSRQILPPTITPAAGSYNTSVSVTIAGNGATAVYYTTDGSDPTVNSTLYSTPFVLTQSGAVKAIGSVAVSSCGVGYVTAITTSTYTISNPNPSSVPSPLAYWTLDAANTSGNVLADKSSSSISLTAFNIASVPGKIGEAMQFNGSTSHLQSADSRLQLNNDLTLMTWIKTTSTRWEALLAKYSNPGYETGYMLRTTADGHLSLRIGGNNLAAPWDTSQRSLVDTGPVINDGQWHQVAAVIKLGTGVTFFIDGAQTSTISKAVSGVAESAAFQVGQSPWPDYASSFTGSLDDIRVYNTALTAQQINYVYGLRGQVAGEFTTGKQIVPVGWVLKGKSNPAIYVILDDGTKYGFKSIKEFTKFGYKLNMVQEVEDNYLTDVANSNINSLTLHPSYTFIKYANSKNVYMLQGGKKRLISSMETLQRLTTVNSIITIVSSFKYPDGEVLY